MYSLQKIFWSLMVFITSINATDLNQTQLCQSFDDGIQTRINNSKIKFINHSYLFNNPDNLLDGDKVKNDNSNLSCRDVNNSTDEACQSSNSLGYSFGAMTRQTPKSFTLALPVTTATNKIKFKENGGTATGTALREQEYKSVKSDWYPNLVMNFEITASLKAGHISTTDAKNTALSFQSADGNPYDIEIRKLLLKKKTNASSDNMAQNIKIKTLRVNKKSSLLLQATTSISLEKLDIDKNSTVTIKAPKVILNSLEALEKCNIKIIANEIDITDITLEKRADLVIESYSEDTPIDMRIDKLKLDKAYTLLNSGEYHIKRVELKNRSELSVGEQVQIINRRVVVLNHSRINASKDMPICDDTHNSNALFIYADDLVRVEDGSKIVGFIYNNRRIELTNHAGIKGAISAKNRAILTNHSKVCYTQCNINPPSVDTTPPVITLNGDSNITITQGEEYSELGATALDDVDGNISVAIGGSVDTATVGVYTITYTAVDNANNSASKIRTVNVIEAPDTTPPVITLNGDVNVTITQGEEYSELNATAIDDVDGNVSVFIGGDVNSSKVGVYQVIYTATDSSNNSATKTRTVNVVEAPDTTPPVITLNGDAEITLTQGSVYSELGATAVDDVDGNLSVTVSSSVDTATVGTYTITYSATDSAGNEATLTREVNVVEPVVEYGVKIGEIYGNTAKLYAQAYFELSLKSQPDSNLTIPLSSSNTNEGDIVGDKQILFTPENWAEPQTVFITGKNKNLGDGEQNYKVILGKIVSDDENYNDIDPDDVDLKFSILSISEPDDKYDFVPTSRKIICLNINTAVSSGLKYNLVDVPDGMTHEEGNEYSPCLEWKAPISESGTTHTLTIEVANGADISKEISFDIHVADTVPLQSEINGDSVTITEPNSNLNGFTVTRKDNSINLEDIKFRKVVNPYLMKHGRNRISDIFIAEKLVVGDIKVTIPQVTGFNIDSNSKIGLFGPLEHHGFISYQASGSSHTNLLIEGTVELEDIFGIGFGHTFLGLESRHFKKLTQQKKIKQLKMFKTDSFGVLCIPTQEHNGSLNYNKQYCSSLDNADINITVKDFAETNTTTRWNGTSIEEMVSWLLEAQKGFNNLSLAYKNRFTVIIENTKTADHPNSTGFVTPKKHEKRNILHLHNDDNLTKEYMKSTTVHEYYHHAQAKIIERDISNGQSHVLTEGKQWFTEGTARWFEDYLYDDLNSYLFKEQVLNQILNVGLNKIVGQSREYRPYQRFAFFKLLKEKCTNFDGIFSSLQLLDNGDTTGVETLKNYLSVGECNFGSHLNETNQDKKASLASALAYYQYATVLKKDMKLLDSNENNMLFPCLSNPNQNCIFTFRDKKVKEITQNNWSGNKINILSTLGSRVPAYGAKSIKIDYDALKNISGDINLSIKTDRPVTVIGIRLDQNGNSNANGINDNFHFTTQAGVSKEYTLTDEDRAGGLFLTLLNATEEEVNILDLNIMEEKKNIPSSFYYTCRLNVFTSIRGGYYVGFATVHEYAYANCSGYSTSSEFPHLSSHNIDTLNELVKTKGKELFMGLQSKVQNYLSNKLSYIENEYGNNTYNIIKYDSETRDCLMPWRGYYMGCKYHYYLILEKK